MDRLLIPVSYTHLDVYKRQEYELNQSDMMLTFFAHVLNKHQDIVDELPSYNGMNCVSDVDYRLSDNRKAEMPTSVSYTHLDVYKRQVNNFKHIFFNNILYAVKNTFIRIYKYPCLLYTSRCV